MATRNGSGPRKGAAARSEKKNRTIEFEGLSLKLPPVLPFRVLRYVDAADSGEAQAVVGILEAMLGDQMDSVWALDISMERGLELVELVFGEFGMTAGESAASPTR